MGDQTSHTGSWGGFSPIMPAFVRLIVSVIVLVVVEAVFLNFPGTSSLILGTQLTIAGVAAFILGLMVAIILLRFGTQLSIAVSDAYKSYKSWSPLLAYFFQIVAIVILYMVSSPIASPYFGSAQWAYPLIFLLIALIPTLKVVTNIVHALDGSAPKHNQS